MVKVERRIVHTDFTLLFVFVVGGMPSFGQNTSCLPDVTAALAYPTAVLESRIQGTVESTVHLDSAGNILDLRSTGNPALKDNVEAAIRSAQFGKQCANEHFSVSVNFSFDQNTDPNSKILVRRRSDSVYDVIAPAQVVVVTISDPAWIFTRRGRILHRIHSVVLKLKFW